MATKQAKKGAAKGRTAARVTGAKRKPARRTVTKRAAPKKRAARTAAAAPPMDPQAMMAAWEKFKTPGEGHRRLEPMIGSFRARTTWVMGPGAPPETSEGSSENRWALGGRYLEQRYSGSAMGMPLEGVGFTGFDNARKKFVGTWMDNFGTGIMYSLGTGKPTNEEIEFESDVVMPTGGTRRYWSKVRIADRDNHSFEMWTREKNGPRYRAMLVEYSRR